AFHVVLALRDLFQTVLNTKQEQIVAKENKSDLSKTEKRPESKDVESTDRTELEIQTKTPEEQKPKDENIYFEVLLTEPLKLKEEEITAEKAEEPMRTVDDLLGLQNEMTKLQEGINQMDSSIAAVAAFNSDISMPENDPFDTSFVLGPKRDSLPFPMPTPIPLASPVPANDNNNQSFNGQSTVGDKYAVFNAIDSTPSIFEASEGSIGTDTAANNDVKDLEDEVAKKAPPAKPPRLSKSASPDLSVFAELDPLGKDRPYKDKTEFFQDVKNPPKKVLNDLVDPNKDSSKAFDMNLLSPSVPFPVDFESMSTNSFANPTLSTSLPNSFSANSKLTLPNGNGERIHNPFEKQDHSGRSVNPAKVLTSRSSEPAFSNVQIMPQNTINNVSYLGKSPPSTAVLATAQQQLTVNCNMANLNHSQLISQQSTSSSPIPIPPRQADFTKDRSYSNGSVGSPYSKSPLPFDSESPIPSDYYIQTYTSSENCSPTGLTLKNGLNIQQNNLTNGENGLTILSPPNNNLSKQTNFSNSTNSSNGVSRPRPRPSLSKGASVPHNGNSFSSHSLSSDSSSDYEAISRENMQSIANVLLTNGHRLRAQSLCLEANNDFNKLQLSGEKNIFAKKNDPFADDFFFSLPKKSSLLTKTEIPEYV
ncbi:protein disabled-like, partial [Stegodyphus dumicola]|uniref:protein disabled-like n=1 Tax=Stegodyphus dumicola TaxID=202533 RepID=UPI0015AFE593